jgi:four helix bundle protein
LVEGQSPFSKLKEILNKSGTVAFRFETLKIWNQARSFSGAVYQATVAFPRTEAYGLTSQLHRAANAVPLLVAEGSALPSNRLFHHRLGLAQGELAEVVCGLFLALDRGYLDESVREDIYESAQSLARQIERLKETLG